MCAWSSATLYREICCGNEDPFTRWERIQVLTKEVNFWFKKLNTRYFNECVGYFCIKWMAKHFQNAGLTSGDLSPLETIKADSLVKLAAAMESVQRQSGQYGLHDYVRADKYFGPRPDQDETKKYIFPSLHLSELLKVDF